MKFFLRQCVTRNAASLARRPLEVFSGRPTNGSNFGLIQNLAKLNKRHTREFTDVFKLQPKRFAPGRYHLRHPTRTHSTRPAGRQSGRGPAVDDLPPVTPGGSFQFVISNPVAVPGAAPRHALGLGQHNTKTMQSDQKRRGFSASKFGQRLLASRS